MKILGLQIENLRKIKIAALDLSQGNLIQIRGRNQAGKSTVLLAAEMLFGGKAVIPNDVIQHGKESAEIIGTIDDYTIKRIIKQNGNHLLSITKDGMKKTKPQEFLNKLTGKFLDPQWFSDLDGPGKKKILMDHLGIDYTDINKKISTLETERTYTGRIIRTMGAPTPTEKLTRVNITDLLAKKQKIDDFNDLQNSRQVAINNHQSHIDDLEKEEQRILSELTAIREKISDAKQCYEALIIPESLKDTSHLIEQIQNAESINTAAMKYNQYIEKKEKYDHNQNHYNELTEQINVARKVKADMLTNATMPVPGLTITDTGLSINGITDENWSDSEALYISLCISAALAKDLKTIFIKRGESLDESSLNELKKFADENDFQVIIEIVDDKYNLTNDNIIYIEEGEILSNE